MATSEADTQTSQDITDTTESDPPDVDWEAVFEANGHEPWEPLGNSALRTYLWIDGYSEDEATAGSILSDAVDAGELEPSQKGFTITGADPPQEEHEPTDTEPEEESRSSESTTPEVDTRDESADTSLEKRVSDLEERFDAMSVQNEQLREENALLRQALGAFVSFDSGDVVVDELPAAMREKSRQIGRLSETVSVLGNQLSSLGEFSKNQEPDKDGKILLIRQHLVEETQKRGTYGMDYNAVHSFLTGMGIDLSPSWASQLLTKAAGEDDGDDYDHPAFYTSKNAGGNKQLRVDLDKIGADSIFRVKKHSGGKEA